MSTPFPFGEWLPDLPPLGLQGCITVTNVTPDAQSYRPFPSLTLFSNSIGGRCKGGTFATDSLNNGFNFAGDASALYALTSVTYAVAGSGYTVASDDSWEFAQWGTSIIAVGGYTDQPQNISLGAASFSSMAIGIAAKHITVMRDFVVLGNMFDSATNAYRVRWSAINNPNSWTVNAATLADFQDLAPDGGPVQRVLGGEYGVVLQQRSIWRMLFVGSPVIFQFDKVHNAIGAYVPQAAIRHQNFTFFLSEDGFYSFDGVGLKPIGTGKVDKFFFDDLDINAINRIHAAIDATNKLVIWAYPSTTSNGNPDKLLIYSWAFDRWTLVDGLNIEYLLSSLQDASTPTSVYTLDGLDVLSSSLDALPLSLDQYGAGTPGTGGRIVLSAFNNDNAMWLFNGSAMAATIETGEFQFAKDARAMLTEIRPDVTGLSSSATISVINRNNLTESASVGSTAAYPNATGFVQCRVSARYFRIRLVTTAGVEFTHLTGVEISGVREGVR